MKNGIGNEISGENVDRIMQVAQKDYDGKKERETEENIPEIFIIPEHEREEERQPGMPGKEKTYAGKYSPEYFFLEKNRGYRRVKRIDVDMGECYKHRAYQGKNSHTLYGEWYVLGISEAQEDSEQKERKCDKDKKNVYVIYPGIRENNVGHRYARGSCRITCCHKLRDKAPGNH